MSKKFKFELDNWSQQAQPYPTPFLLPNLFYLPLFSHRFVTSTEISFFYIISVK